MKAISSGEEQMEQLSLYLKNRVNFVLPRDPELRIAVNKAIDEGLKAFLEKQRLEAYAGVDVGKLAEELATQILGLKTQVKRLQDVVPGFDNLTESSEVVKDVVVGKLHRVTLREFPVGASLRRTHLKRNDGSVWGINLVRRW